VEHLSHFGLSRDPFVNDPLLSFYFEDEAFSNVERRLLRGAIQGKGLCVLTGPGGSGKTMLLRHLLESLEEEAYEPILLIPMHGVSDGRWILDRFARQLGVDEPAEEPSKLLGQLYAQLAVVREDGRRAVLIVDEAQVLAEQGGLGELRGLLNLEYEDRRLLTVVLAGLPGLVGEMANGPALAERVELRAEIPSLDADASARYLSHRIHAVDGDPAILDSDAIETIASAAGGNPRRLNVLADNSLYEAYLAGRVHVTAEDVARAAADLGLSPEDAEGAPKPGEATPLVEEAAAEATADAPSEIDEVIAVDTDPPVLDGESAEAMALLAEDGPPKDEEIDDLFVDLVDQA
jgi:type II secretory pathway predicted ATPase ExeA